MEVCITKPQWGRVWLSFCYPRAHLGAYSSSVIHKDSILVCWGYGRKQYVSFLHFGRPWGSIWTSLGSICAPLGHPWVHLGIIWAPLGSSWASFGSPWAPFGDPWAHFRVFLTLWGGALDPFGHFWAKALKKVPQIIETGTKNGGIFDEIFSFCGKWPTAFGPGRLDRIGVRAPWFGRLGFPFEPLVLV